MTNPLAPNAERFEPASAETLAAWADFPKFGGEFFANHLGLEQEEIRTDYCRLRLPYADFLPQPAGVVHGGAIATLCDTVVVPAVAGPYDLAKITFATINLDVNYLRPAVQSDVVAEGWVVRRGRSVVFCSAEVRRATDASLVATASVTYSVKELPSG